MVHEKYRDEKKVFKETAAQTKFVFHERKDNKAHEREWKMWK